MSASTYERLKLQCQREGTSVKAKVEQLVTRYLGDQPDESPHAELTWIARKVLGDRFDQVLEYYAGLAIQTACSAGVTLQELQEIRRLYGATEVGVTHHCHDDEEWCSGVLWIRLVREVNG